MIHGHNIKDAELHHSAALPNGANTTHTDAIEVHSTGKKTAFVAQCIARVAYPALGATPLPDAGTITYSVQHSDTIDSGYEPVASKVQTGADGAGAAAGELRIGLPDNVKRFIRGTAVKSGTGNASGSTFTLELLF